MAEIVRRSDTADFEVILRRPVVARTVGRMLRSRHLVADDGMRRNRSGATSPDDAAVTPRQGVR